MKCDIIHLQNKVFWYELAIIYNISTKLMEYSVLHIHSAVLDFQYIGTAAPPYQKYLKPLCLIRRGYLVSEECATGEYLANFKKAIL